jgi:subtilisin family serine protease
LHENARLIAVFSSDAYVYVVDDGMNVDHVDFEGRAKWGWTAYTGISPLGGGHGTHVSGTIGSKTYGIAKKTNLVAVQVLNEEGSGAISSILAGLQFVTDNAKSHKGKALINMSLGMSTAGGSSPALKAFDDAINAVVQSGIPIIAAAGNSNSDACSISPAGNKNVYAVGATDKNDAMTSFSCYGQCVQINAPGNNIKSLYIDSKTSTTTMSGTSMSSPHVAGVAALIIGGISEPTPANLYKELTNIATKGVVGSLKGSTPNLLLFNGQQLTSD